MLVIQLDYARAAGLPQLGYPQVFVILRAVKVD
jgi:hypothetical protein